MPRRWSEGQFINHRRELRRSGEAPDLRESALVPEVAPKYKPERYRGQPRSHSLSNLSRLLPAHRTVHAADYTRLQVLQAEICVRLHGLLHQSFCVSGLLCRPSPTLSVVVVTA